MAANFHGVTKRITKDFVESCLQTKATYVPLAFNVYQNQACGKVFYSLVLNDGTCLILVNLKLN